MTSGGFLGDVWSSYRSFQRFVWVIFEQLKKVLRDLPWKQDWHSPVYSGRFKTRGYSLLQSRINSRQRHRKRSEKINWPWSVLREHPPDAGRRIHTALHFCQSRKAMARFCDTYRHRKRNDEIRMASEPAVVLRGRNCTSAQADDES